MILSVIAKPSDCGCYRLVQDGKVVKTMEGYVPNGLGIGSGDYIEFDIDLESGQLVGWQPITEEDLEEFLDQD